MSKTKFTDQDIYNYLCINYRELGLVNLPKMKAIQDVPKTPSIPSETIVEVYEVESGVSIDETMRMIAAKHRKGPYSVTLSLSVVYTSENEEYTYIDKDYEYDRSSGEEICIVTEYVEEAQKPSARIIHEYQNRDYQRLSRDYELEIKRIKEIRANNARKKIENESYKSICSELIRNTRNNHFQLWCEVGRKMRIGEISI